MAWLCIVSCPPAAEVQRLEAEDNERKQAEAAEQATQAAQAEAEAAAREAASQAHGGAESVAGGEDHGERVLQEEQQEEQRVRRSARLLLTHIAAGDELGMAGRLWPARSTVCAWLALAGIVAHITRTLVPAFRPTPWPLWGCPAGLTWRCPWPCRPR